MTYNQDYWNAVAEADRALKAFGAICAGAAAEIREAEVIDELDSYAQDLNDLVNADLEADRPSAPVVNLADRRESRRD